MSVTDWVSPEIRKMPLDELWAEFLASVREFYKDSGDELPDFEFALEKFAACNAPTSKGATNAD